MYITLGGVCVARWTQLWVAYAGVVLLGRYGRNVQVAMVMFSMMAEMFFGSTFTAIEVQRVEASFVTE